MFDIVHDQNNLDKIKKKLVIRIQTWFKQFSSVIKEQGKVIYRKDNSATSFDCTTKDLRSNWSKQFGLDQEKTRHSSKILVQSKVIGKTTPQHLSTVRKLQKVKLSLFLFEKPLTVQPRIFGGCYMFLVLTTTPSEIARSSRYVLLTAYTGAVLVWAFFFFSIHFVNFLI